MELCLVSCVTKGWSWIWPARAEREKKEKEKKRHEILHAECFPVLISTKRFCFKLWHWLRLWANQQQNNNSPTPPKQCDNILGLGWLSMLIFWFGLHNWLVWYDKYNCISFLFIMMPTIVWHSHHLTVEIRDANVHTHTWTNVWGRHFERAPKPPEARAD